MLISLLTKIFGIYFGLRILESFFRENNIPDALLTKIVSSYLCIQALALIIFAKNRWDFIFIFIPIFIFFIAVKIYLKWLENQFCSAFPDILTHVILNIKSGKSFRTSLQQATQTVPMRFRYQWGRICELVVFSPQPNDKKMAPKSPFIHQIGVQFIKIDRSSFKTVEKLESFRRKYVIMQQFRRKSGQIRGQIQLQSNILILLYAICFAFVSWSFSLKELQSLIFISLSLFILGQLIVFAIGRRVSWKI